MYLTKELVLPKKIENIYKAFIVKSKGHIGKYNKLKGIHYGKAMCYSIPIRGDQVTN